MNKYTFKNIAHTVKEWAIRFFGVYFFVYVALIALLLASSKKYILPLIICTLIHILNTFLKIKLNKNNQIVNLGLKQGICVIVFLFTYLVLMLMGRNNIIDAVVFIISVIILFSCYETTVNLVEFINIIISAKKTIPDVQCFKKTFLSKLVATDKEWNKSDFDSDEISKMLYEFINISNDNQMGHVVIRSMTTIDENNVERLCVKAKEGYHIIIRGTLEQISSKCSDVLFDGKLTEINDEIINDFKAKLDGVECADKIVCAFKEISDINADENDNFILVGCGLYEYETIDLPAPDCKLKVSENYKDLIISTFSLLILSVLVTSNVFASLFDAVVFNVNSLLISGIISVIFTTVISLCGDFDTGTYKKNITLIISVICVNVTYFFGRYVMLNSDYVNDLFYVVTANVMAVVTIITYAILTVLTSVKYYTKKTLIVSYVVCALIIVYTFLPCCTKLMYGYNINCIFISVALLISVIGVAICKIINFILRIKNNGKQISN